MRAQTMELLECREFRLVAEVGIDWERDEMERRQHDEIMERIAAAQMALPIVGGTKPMDKQNAVKAGNTNK